MRYNIGLAVLQIGGHKTMSMHRSLPIRLAILLLVLGLAGSFPQAQISALFSQDLTLHESTTMTGAPMGGGNGNQTQSTKYFSGNAMKQASDNGDFIIRLDQNKMIMVDHKKKTYSEMTFDQMEQMLQKSMANSGMSQEQMEAMRQIMGQTVGSVSVTPQGAGETIAGYATEKYLVKIPPMELELSNTPDLAIPAEYYDAIKLATPKNPMFDMSKMYDEMKKVKGMTLKSVMSMKMMGMNITTTTVVKSVEKGAIPASVFDPPAGYKAAPFQF